MKTPLIIIGLDGASWRVLMPWIRAGYLPSLEKVITFGVYATLVSSIPPVTCPAWRCYSTGKNPGKLGVFWWVGINRKTGKLTMPCSRSFKSKDLWDYFDKNTKIGLINLPMTYPPKRVNGFLVSGFGAPLNIDFKYPIEYAYPAQFRLKIEKKYDYKVGVNFNRLDKDALLKSTKELISMRFDLALDSLKEKKVDFLNVTIFYINVLHHFYGTDNVVLEAWKHIDKYIGKILKLGHNIIFISDHGSAEIKKSFIINAWLEKEGYLKRKKHVSDALYNITSNLDKLFKLQKINSHLSFVSLLRLALPKRIVRILPDKRGYIATNLIDLKTDWLKTSAIGLSQGPIYLNNTLLRGKNTIIKAEIIKKLKRLKDPKNGELIFKKVYSSEQLYCGPYRNKGPDIILVPNDPYEIVGDLGLKVLDQQPLTWTSGNHPSGIFAAYGADIAKGKLNKLSIYDIAPTVLHLMDCKIPSDMDGCVRKDVYKKISLAFKRKVSFRDIEKDKLKLAIKLLTKNLKF